MNCTVRLRAEAELDIASAASWYEQQCAGLGHEFLDEVLATFKLVGEQPTRYPIVHRDTRRAVVSRFPFGVFFRHEQDQVVVVAVIHGSRHPRHWQHRT